MTPWVAYVGPFLFPWGQPGSRRVYGIAKSLAMAGYDVVVGTGEDRPRSREHLEYEGPREIHRIGLGELNQGDRSRVVKAFKALVVQGAATVRWLEAQRQRPSHVIVYGAYAPFMTRMLRWCRRNDVPLVADVVEWYEPSHLPGGRFGPFRATTGFALRWQYPRCDGVIAISSFLARHYERRGVKVVRVPPTLDVATTPTRAIQSNSPSPVLKLIYAGSPGKKDLLRNVIAGLREVDPEGKRVMLNVLGVTEAQLRATVREVALGFAGARALGKVAQPEVAKAYLGADFSVLLREPLRYAQAGFPTKVVESLSAGVPVICNMTSDLAEGIRDGIEGFRCVDHGPRAFADALRRALATSSPQRGEMARAARATAERWFDYRNYSGVLATFMREVAR